MVLTFTHITLHNADWFINYSRTFGDIANTQRPHNSLTYTDAPPVYLTVACASMFSAARVELAMCDLLRDRLGREPVSSSTRSAFPAPRSRARWRWAQSGQLWPLLSYREQYASVHPLIRVGAPYLHGRDAPDMLARTCCIRTRMRLMHRVASFDSGSRDGVALLRPGAGPGTGGYSRRAHALAESLGLLVTRNARAGRRWQELAADATAIAAGEIAARHAENSLTRRLRALGLPQHESRGWIYPTHDASVYA